MGYSIEIRCDSCNEEIDLSTDSKTIHDTVAGLVELMNWQVISVPGEKKEYILCDMCDEAVFMRKVYKKDCDK